MASRRGQRLRGTTAAYHDFVSCTGPVLGNADVLARMGPRAPYQPGDAFSFPDDGTAAPAPALAAAGNKRMAKASMARTPAKMKTGRTRKVSHRDREDNDNTPLSALSCQCILPLLFVRYTGRHGDAGNTSRCGRKGQGARRGAEPGLALGRGLCCQHHQVFPRRPLRELHGHPGLNLAHRGVLSGECPNHPPVTMPT